MTLKLSPKKMRGNPPTEHRRKNVQAKQRTAKAGMSLAYLRCWKPLWMKPDEVEGAQSQMARGPVGQGKEHRGDSKCSRKLLEGSREKWTCPDSYLYIHLGSYVERG